MAEGKRAGWYPDPSGLTKKFRWWDGERWTVAVAETLWAKEPDNPPRYVPPPPGRPTADVAPAGPSLPTVVEVEDLGTGGRRRWVVGVVAAVVVLGGVATAAAVWLSRDGGTTPVAASASPTTAPSATPSPSPTDPADPTQSPSPTPASQTPTTTSTPQAGEHLAFNPPGSAWRAATGTVLRQDLGSQQAYFQNTEELWDGKQNWTALMVAGDLPADAQAGAKGDLPARTTAVARWFLRTEWNSPPSAGPGNGKSLVLGGHPAYRVRTQVAYDFKGLKSKHDNIDIVLIDYGPDRPNGLFIASIPETHPQLAKDVDSALYSLRLERTAD